NSMPGLNVVHFVDAKTGYLLGDGSDQYPSGVFMTDNGGLQWQPVAGPRCASWLAGFFEVEFAAKGGTPFKAGTLVGCRNQLSSFHNDRRFEMSDRAMTDERSLRGVYLRDERGARRTAVGEGCLVETRIGAEERWSVADLKMPRELLDSLDLH